MKILLLNESRQSIGGGWSFMDNLAKGLTKAGHHVVYDIQECDVCLIPSASMIHSRDTFARARKLSKKLFLRVDNILKNSRNRNSGMSRMYDFAQHSDMVIYQSKWAQRLLSPYLKSKGVVVYNGVDTTVFNEKGVRIDLKGSPVYLYSRFNREDSKRWYYAWYRYQELQREQPKAVLVVVGKFSPENIKYNFDFFNGENYLYLGIVGSKTEMAKIYRSCDYLFACYEFDCYSNTYLEALACGCKLFEPSMTGGTPELIKNGVRSIEQMTQDYLGVFNG